MKRIKVLPGFRPLAFVPEGILLAKRYDLYVADLKCAQLNPIGSIPRSVAARIGGMSRLLERIFRLGVRLGCRISPHQILLAEKRRIWLLDLSRRSISLDHTVENGSRPLTITPIQGIPGFEDGACYGEYWENEHKKPVRIWLRNGSGVWRVAHTFAKGDIEHVHAVVPDSRRGLVWILTGDFGKSAGIWAARNDFSQVWPVLVGQQEFRCCWLAFWADRIIYATDSPLESNSIRELVLQDARLDSGCGNGAAHSKYLTRISGSSIYSCMAQDQLIFSTAVEPGLLGGRFLQDWFERTPGPGIESNHAELLLGNCEEGFSVVGRWPKDALPPRLCEFGSISFPTGINPGRYVYAYFTGLSGLDGSMSVFELPSPVN